MTKFKYKIVPYIQKTQDNIDFELLPQDNIAMLLVPILEHATEQLNDAMAHYPEKDWEAIDHYITFQSYTIIVTFLLKRPAGVKR